MKIELFVIGCETDSSRVLLTLPAVIGRGNDADLVVEHPEVSRHHCRLFWYQNSVHIQDLRSLNGTIIGSRRIQNSESPIQPNETFTVGPVPFRIQYSRQEVPANDFSGSSSRSRARRASNSTNSGSPALKK